MGAVCAIAITTAMDVTGLSSFSALALLPLMLLFWWLSRFSGAEIGFRPGRASDYGLATLFPLAVMGVIAIIAFLARAIDVGRTNWPKAAANLLLITVSTFLVAIVTEEGFFRGWFWGALKRVGMRNMHVLAWSSIAFALWHVSAVTLDPDFRPRPIQIPVYLCNATAMGAVWGFLRLRSGSIVVSSLSHGLWNGMAYVLFGFGSRSGALGIRNTGIFGPEVGFLGLGLNLAFAFLLWTSLKQEAAGEDE